MVQTRSGRITKYRRPRLRAPLFPPFPCTEDECVFYDTLPVEAQVRCHQEYRRVQRRNVPDAPLRFQVLEADLPIKLKVACLRHLDVEDDNAKHRQYVELVLQLPRVQKTPRWHFATQLRRAKAQLDKCIYGQARAKTQILRCLARRFQDFDSMTRPIALLGPPGVGKTAICQHGIAPALGQGFHFVALGGQDDVSHLIGHSFCYEAAQPGELVRSLLATQSVNPVILFDEVDKVANPAMTNMLLHLCDPQHNTRVVDRFLGSQVALDMSRAQLVFTLNHRSEVSPILLDRLQIVEMQEYSEIDKIEIAQERLVPAALKELRSHGVRLSKQAIQTLVRSHSAEGVRYLQRLIADVVHEAVLIRDAADVIEAQYIVKSQWHDKQCLVEEVKIPVTSRHRAPSQMYT